MSKINDFNKIGQVYGNMLNGIRRGLVAEGKLGPAIKPGEIGDAPLQDGGPNEKGGFKPAEIDKHRLSKKQIEDNLYNIDDLSEDEETKAEQKKISKDIEKEMKSYKRTGKIGTSKPATKEKALKQAIAVAYSKAGKAKPKEEGEETIQEVTKNAQERLNNFMRQKSIFDKLYENVMGNPGAVDSMENSGMSEAEELDALGVETDSEETDEVTFTLDRETAKKLHDVLMSVLGEEEVEGEDETEGEDEGEEYGMADEDEEDLGHTNVNAKEPNMGKNNKVGNLKPQSGVISAYTDKVGADGDLGHTLVNAKEPNMGKNNKVGNLKTGKSAFDK